MPIHPIYQDLSPSDILLDNLFLDPNNPRFVDSRWDYVPETEISRQLHQDRARKQLIERFGIDKLRSNMEVNGYLPIDRVIVQEIEPDKYVVLEGNRRICAAKLIHEAAENNASAVSEEILRSVREIPCLIYTGDSKDAAWIFQGLRHITGIVEWSAYNKAKLLVEQMDEEGLSLTGVGKRFGLTPYGAGQWVRGYKAFQQALDRTDYVHEIDQRSFPYFQELFGRSNGPLRDWLEWDDNEKEFNNDLNFNEFVGWLYPRDDEYDEDEISSETLGKWENRLFSSRNELRTISYLIRDEMDIFQQFRETGNLESSYSMALTRKYEKQAKEKANPQSEVFEAIKNCTKYLENVPFRMLRDEEISTRLFRNLQQLEDAIKALKS